VAREQHDGFHSPVNETNGTVDWWFIYKVPKLASDGFTPSEFTQISATRIAAQLEAALAESEFVSIYGQVFDDGGANGKGIHETHYTGLPNQDGAIAVYTRDPTTNTPKRTWFFFKFNEDSIQPASRPPAALT